MSKRGTPVASFSSTTRTLVAVEGPVSLRYVITYGYLDVALDPDENDIAVTCHRTRRNSPVSELVGLAHVRVGDASNSKCFQNNGIVYIRETYIRDIVAELAAALWESSSVPVVKRQIRGWWNLATDWATRAVLRFENGQRVGVTS